MPVKNKMRERGSRTWQGRASDRDADLTKSVPAQQKALEQRLPIRGIESWVEWPGPVSHHSQSLAEDCGEGRGLNSKAKTDPEGAVVGGHQ